MTYSQIQRRAFTVALITMTAIAAAILCYWQAVRKGVLPSPVQPLVQRQPAHAAKAPAPAELATAHAVIVPTAPAVAPREVPAPPKPVAASAQVHKAPEPARSKSDSSASAEPVRAAPLTAEPSAPTRAGETASVPRQVVAEEAPKPEAGPATPAPSRPAPAELSEEKQADRRVAEEWLQHPEKRPVVRVHYALADVLRLVSAGRGVIVAANEGPAESRRELYLQSTPGAPALFAPYTKNVADAFSSYSMRLRTGPGLEGLKATLPLYFHNADVALAFVPDQRLATEIFARVAEANRSRGAEAPGGDRPKPAGQTIFDGELTMDGLEPRFQVLDVKSGSEQVSLGSTEPAANGPDGPR